MHVFPNQNGELLLIYLTTVPSLCQCLPLASHFSSVGEIAHKLIGQFLSILPQHKPAWSMKASLLAEREITARCKSDFCISYN